MAKSGYVVANGVTNKIKKGYVVVDGVTRKIKKSYTVVDGKTRLAWSGNGLMYGISSTKFYKSTDGVNWTYVSDLPSLEDYSQYGITYGDDLVCDATGKIIMAVIGTSMLGYVGSIDGGLTWFNHSSLFGDSGYWYYPHKIVYGNGVFVATSTTPDSNIVRLAYSYDGRTWTQVNNVYNVSSSYYVHLASLNFVNGYFIWEGDSTSHYSINGINWTATNNAIINSYASFEGTELIYNDKNKKYYGIVIDDDTVYYRDTINGTTTFSSGVGRLSGITIFKDNIYVTSASSSSGMGYVSYTTSIYKSIDKGVSFTKVLESITGYNNYLGVGGFITTDDILYLKMRDGNYYYTYDGNTFTYVESEGDAHIDLIPNCICYL